MSDAHDPVQDALPLSPTDTHILLVLAEQPLYGYAILKAVDDESSGLVQPDLGGLYRALARLRGQGLVDEAPAPAGAAASPGRTRRYFEITGLGQRVLRAEAQRLQRVIALADQRLTAEALA